MRQLLYITMSSASCQHLFFYLFSDFLFRVGRSLTTLISYHFPPPFVNTFFKLFLTFFCFFCLRIQEKRPQNLSAAASFMFGWCYKNGCSMRFLTADLLHPDPVRFHEPVPLCSARLHMQFFLHLLLHYIFLPSLFCV